MKWKTPKAGPLRLSLSAMQVGNICGIDFMAHGPQVCHCEEAVGRRGNLGKALTISPMTFLLSNLVLRDSHVASLLGMTNLGACQNFCDFL